MIKRITALFLTLCMLLAATPAVFAETDELQFTPVSAKVAASEAVRSSSTRVAGTSVVNGHDYLYLFLTGNKLLVYDLDTKQKVDEETNAFGTPRGMTVDSRGIVWATGANSFLYRYDPYTKIGSTIPFSGGTFPNDNSFNGLGIVADENDVLYFGTYNRGYIGMYAPYSGDKPVVTRISEWLNTSDALRPDAIYAGYGGLLYKDGFLYLGIDGNKNGDSHKTHEIVKFSIEQRKIVDWVDITDCWGPGGEYLGYLNLVGDYILGGSNSMLNKTVAIDISGPTMKKVTLAGDMDVGFSGFVSDPINGKAYCLGNTKKGDGMFEIDLNTMNVTELDQEKWPPDSTKLVCRGGSLVTIEGDDRLPGTSLVTIRNNETNATTEPVFYNIQTGETVIWEAFTLGEGSGNQMRTLATDPLRKNVYAGAYGYNAVAEYNIAEGSVTQALRTYDHQVDGLIWYGDHLYAGNYEQGTITQVDVEAGTATPFFALKNTAFNQCRMHAMGAGDNKVFVGTVPYKELYGGMLAWYDLDEKRTYVATGPNKEDVYWADGDAMAKDCVWRNAVTGDALEFIDTNGDGANDPTIIVGSDKVQRFNGVIKNQTINCIVYKDGYIYGSTTKSGGQGTILDVHNDGPAKLFVYDVAEMKVIATLNITEAISGLATPVQLVDVIADDPDVPGKFWGVVSDTLFSFTFDIETKTFDVTEELSLGKKIYDLGGNAWASRSIVFVGDYMCVIFGSKGTYVVDRNDPSHNTLLSSATPKQMVLGEDMNLYYVDNSVDLKVLKVGSLLGKLQTAADNKKAAAAVDALISAVGTVTLDSEAAVTAARAAYNALNDDQKALVSNLAVLETAEATLAELRATLPAGDTAPLALFAVLAVCILTVFTALVILVLNKKRTR